MMVNVIMGGGGAKERPTETEEERNDKGGVTERPLQVNEDEKTLSNAEERFKNEKIKEGDEKEDE